MDQRRWILARYYEKRSKVGHDDLMVIWVTFVALITLPVCGFVYLTEWSTMCRQYRTYRDLTLPTPSVGQASELFVRIDSSAI